MLTIILWYLAMGIGVDYTARKVFKCDLDNLERLVIITGWLPSVVGIVTVYLFDVIHNLIRKCRK